MGHGALAVATALACVATACSKGSDTGGKHGISDAPTTADAAAATTTAPPRGGVGQLALSGISPLTGLPGDPTVLARPALIVKIDNAPEARPQSGLDQADLVVEEKVEGTVVRFLVVFHSHDAATVGPVRSVRSTDPPVVRPLGGLFAYSGGIPEFVALLHGSAGVQDVGADAASKAYTRRKGRTAPHNLYTSTAALYRSAAGTPGPPPVLFPRLGDGQAFDPPGAAPAAKATVVFGIRTTAVWDYDAASARWLRSTNGTPHTLEGGARLAFPTVILQQVPYRDTGFKDQSKAVVDEAVVVGAGNATVLVAGRQVQAHWSKPTPEAVTTFADSAGQPILLPPGPVWVSLVPVEASVTIQ